MLLNDVAKALDRELPVPLHVQLKGLIEYGISCGELTAGARLPSVRELAAAGGIAPMTAVAVYRDLRAAGLIETRSGAGTFVASGVMPGRAAGLAQVGAHLDAALAAGEASGLEPHQVASILNARIGLGRVGTNRPMRLLMLGVFPEATRSYAREIARHLRPSDTIEPWTIEDCRDGDFIPAVDLVVTLAHRLSDAERIVAGRIPVTSVSFFPSERTRLQLAEIKHAARVGIVAVFPEFLTLMKPGVLRFAPQARDVSAIVVDDPGLNAFAQQIDVLVYASGSECVLDAFAPEIPQIEYRHVPDTQVVSRSLLPLVETIRAGSSRLVLASPSTRLAGQPSRSGAIASKPRDSASAPITLVEGDRSQRGQRAGRPAPRARVRT